MIDNDWCRFLNETKSWIEPVALPKLVSVTAAIFTEQPEGVELSSDSLCKKIFLKIDATPSLGLSRSAVRLFNKVIFFGGVFRFPAEIGQPTFRTPFSNKPVSKDLVQAYARGVTKRLRSKFDLTAKDLPELLKLLFTPEMAEAEEALRQALTEVK